MSVNAETTVSVCNLSANHLEAFTQSLHRIISMDLTRHVFAQIVDGKPIVQLNFDVKTGRSITPAPIAAPPEAVERAKCFQESFSADLLEVNSDLAQFYQDTPIDSRDFKLRLLEMAATAFHNTAAVLFNQTKEQSNTDGAQFAEQSSYTGHQVILDPNMPTPLRHVDYMDYDQYPLGIADIVGYWAELQVLGGVVLFDRGSLETEILDAYIHPVFPYKIYKLSDLQLDSFVEYGISAVDKSTSLPESPLPFRSEKYATRINPDESMRRHIFRSRYERKPFHLRGLSSSYHRPTVREDYPDLVDFLEKRKASRDRAEGDDR